MSFPLMKRDVDLHLDNKRFQPYTVTYSGWKNLFALIFLLEQSEDGI